MTGYGAVTCVQTSRLTQRLSGRWEWKETLLKIRYKLEIHGHRDRVRGWTTVTQTQPVVLKFSTLNAPIDMSVERHEGHKTRNAATSPSGVCGVLPKHRARGYSRGGKNYSKCSTPRVWSSSHNPLCTPHHNILRQVNSMFYMFKSKFILYLHALGLTSNTLFPLLRY